MTPADGPWAARLHAARPGALYVHVPFCVRRCAYCDFATAAVAADDPLVSAYLRSLASQLSQLAAAGLLDGCATGYVGGGTPTHVGARPLGRLVAALRRAAPRLGELSCEANPESLTGEVVAALAGAGATRLSVGVQSLDDGELAALGRAHDARRAREAVRAALGAGLEVSVDLMCATPRQTAASWRETLLEALGLGVRHVSVYPLSLEEGTPLERSVRGAGGKAPWNDPDVQADRMEEAEGLLAAAGLARYEVASYAATGHRCAHNVAYWSAIPYLGLGASAAGMLTAEGYDALRAACLPQLPPRPPDTARARLVVASGAADIAADGRLSSLRLELELLDGRQAVAEDLMLGARMSGGTPAGLLAHARELLGGELDRAVERVARRGLATCADDRLVPTRRGWLRGNELFGELWGLAGAPVRALAC